LIDTSVQDLGPLMNDFLLPQINVAGEAAVPKDQLTHGTSMAATILRGLTLGPAESGGSSVRVLPVDVYGNNPETTTFDLARGIYAAMGAGASVINLSLGGSGDSRLLANLIQDAHRQGVIFVGAAGNQPTGLPTYPAAYPTVIAVTAGDKNGNIAPYANFGSFVDVIAPGVSMVHFEGQSYLVRGTSAAAAYVSGTAASYRAAGSAPAEIEARLRHTPEP
jgi:thermitase